jgi:hypothetical protein
MIKNNAMMRLNNSGSNFGRFNFASINKEHKTIIKGITTTNTNPATINPIIFCFLVYFFLDHSTNLFIICYPPNLFILNKLANSTNKSTNADNVQQIISEFINFYNYHP